MGKLKSSKSKIFNKSQESEKEAVSDRSDDDEDSVTKSRKDSGADNNLPSKRATIKGMTVKIKAKSRPTLNKPKSLTVDPDTPPALEMQKLQFQSSNDNHRINAASSPSRDSVEFRATFGANRIGLFWLSISCAFIVNLKYICASWPVYVDQILHAYIYMVFIVYYVTTWLLYIDHLASFHCIMHASFF